MKSSPAKKSPTRKKAARAAEGTEAKEEKRQAKVLETIENEVTAKPEQEHLEEDVSVECPYCGEGFEVHITSEQDGQSIYEDCQVCSRSFSLHIQVEEGELQVEAYRS
jgi:transcription elongation factor Elf1